MTGTREQHQKNSDSLVLSIIESGTNYVNYSTFRLEAKRKKR